MPHIIYSRQARRDLERHEQFLAAYDTDVALDAVTTIYAALTILENHPEAGRPVPDICDGCREWCIPFGNGGYVALYNVDARAVYILAIRHQRELEYDPQSPL